MFVSPYLEATELGHGYLKSKFFGNRTVVTVFVVWFGGTELDSEYNMGKSRAVEITTTFSKDRKGGHLPWMGVLPESEENEDVINEGPLSSSWGFWVWFKKPLDFE